VRSLTPLHLLRTLPAFTTADFFYIGSELLDVLPSAVKDLRIGAQALSSYLAVTTDSFDPVTPYISLTPLVRSRIRSFAEPISQISPALLPLLVRSGLPPSFLSALARFFSLSRIGSLYENMPKLIGVSPTTLRRRTKNSPHARLAPRETDTVLRLLILTGTMTRATTSYSRLLFWLHAAPDNTPSSSSPLRLICTSPIGLSSGLLTRFRRALTGKPVLLC
jgi:hypothetical protein